MLNRPCFLFASAAPIAVGRPEPTAAAPPPPMVWENLSMFQKRGGFPLTTEKSLVLTASHISAHTRPVLTGFASQAYVASVRARCSACSDAAASFFPLSSKTRRRSAVMSFLQASIKDG